MKAKYEYTGRIRYSEVDEEGRLTLPGLVNYFQDTATFQGEDIGFGIEVLKERQLAWVLSFWQIEYSRRPRLGETVTAATWAYRFQHFFGYRDFTLTSQSGEELARANSLWVLYDIARGCPVRVDEDLQKLYGTDEALDMPKLSRKLSIPEGGEKLAQITVQPEHLDTNHHMNNGRYISLAEGMLPERMEIRGVLAQYRMQARQGDRICPRLVAGNEGVAIALENPEGKEYAAVCFRA